ncbi:MAG: sialidase family protein [Candidatus Hodarchaeales archaeon]
MKIKFYVIFLVVLLFLFSGIVNSSGNDSLSNSNEFSENILLSTLNNPYPHHVEPTFAISENGTLFAGWKNAMGPSSGGVRVSFSKSIDNGKTWSSPFNMPYFNSSIITGQSDPWMTWFNGTLYYVYIEFLLSNPFQNLDLSQITLARSFDYGESWQMTRASNNTNFADKETMVIKPDGTIFIAYGDAPSTGSNRMRLSVSTDGGQTFNDSLYIDDFDIETVDQLSPYIDVTSNGELFVSWIKFTTETYTGHLVIDKLGDEGFGNDQRITEGNYALLTLAPDGSGSKWSLPVLRFDSNDRLYILWSDISEPAGSWDVYLKYSDDFGETWSEHVQINPNTEGNQWMGDLDIDKNNNLHIVYYDEQGESYRPIYNIVSVSNNELTISDPIPAANANTSSIYTRPGDYMTVRIDSDLRTHVVWSDGRNNDMDIYYANCDCIKVDDESSQSSSDTQTAFIDSFGILLAILLMSIRYNKKKEI